MEANLKDGASKLKDEITKHKLEMEAQRKDHASHLKDEKKNTNLRWKHS